MQGAVTITVIPEHGDSGPGPITLHWGVGVKSATDWQVERLSLKTALIQPEYSLNTDWRLSLNTALTQSATDWQVERLSLNTALIQP